MAGDENEEEAEPSVVDRGRLRDHGIVDLHRAAWLWAQSNRLPDGALPSGKAIVQSHYARVEQRDIPKPQFVAADPNRDVRDTESETLRAASEDAAQLRTVAAGEFPGEDAHRRMDCTLPFHE
ncbi:hypothetical protein ACWEN6_29940 [Sphaerisporangium sp. NPDC004334]